MLIRDRIKEFRRVPANQLLPNPKNWRTHPEAQLDALRGVLSEIGFASAELVRELEDGSLMLIDGHARAEIMGSNEIPVLILDVTESEADQLLVVFDPIASMATSNAETLDSLLKDVNFSSEALQELCNGIATKAGLYCDDWKHEDDVPEYDERTETANLRIDGVLKSDAEQLLSQINAMLDGTSYKCTMV